MKPSITLLFREVYGLQTISSLTYALDIGTRTVAGIVLDGQEPNYQIVAGKIAEQEPGAMQDGQIHDITKVARTIRHVTSSLEAKIGRVPQQVAVAAAGRTLKTILGTASLTVSPIEPIDESTIQSLEMQAVLKARESLQSRTGTTAPKKQDWASEYIFVAYSPMVYYLDNEPIGSLLGHRGASIGADVLVTFLPRIVIDSLSASLSAAGLEMGSLTLEPIAAIQTAIPLSMRRLNLALVDIGAGTSDIALTRDGVIFAYGMVSVAGDEITEALCQHYLLDFRQGERLKRQLQRKERLIAENVLGQEIYPKADEVTTLIQPAVEKLASAISQEILRLGSAAPQAVICIGGGSLTPSLREKIASLLGLPTHLVAVRGREALPNVEGYRNTLSGPDCITPIAIAVNAKTANSVFTSVTVNGRALRLLGVSMPTVKDALLAAGIGPREIQGRPGAALTFTLNGEVQVVPGTMGEPGIIRVDGQEVTLDTPIANNASITIDAGQAGAPASLSIRDCIALPEPLTIICQDEKIVVPPDILRNGRSATYEDRIADRDIVSVVPRRRVSDVLQWLQEQGRIESRSMIYYTLNGKACLHMAEVSVWVNNVQVPHDTELEDGDQLEIEMDDTPLTLEQLRRVHGSSLGESTVVFSITIAYNQQPITLAKEPAWAYTRQGQAASPDDIVQDGDEITIAPLEHSDEPGFILSDIFNSPSFTPPVHDQGGTLIIKLNNSPAGFTSPISHGDVIEMYWAANRTK